MLNASRSIQYQKYEKSEAPSSESGDIIVEEHLTLMVNGEEWLTFMCTPLDLEALGIGFLYNENIIESMNEISNYTLCKNSAIDIWLTHEAKKPQEWLRTSGCTGGKTHHHRALVRARIENTKTLPPDDIFNSVELLLASQSLYRTARGVHCSILCDGKKVLHVSEDIGRHNTFDKLAGLSLMKPAENNPRMIVTTGRVSSEMMQKAARLGATTVISLTSPTTTSVTLAGELGVTLIGYARKSSFNVYTNNHLIIHPHP